MKVITAKAVRISLSFASLALGMAACAPAPLYLSAGQYNSGKLGGAVTGGEVPRDARGEPVWNAIRLPPGLTMPGVAMPNGAAEPQEGDAEDRPRPPTT